MNGLAFSHLCDTKCSHWAPIKQNITLVDSYHMWCDLALDRIYFSITNSCYPSNQCHPLNRLLGNLYSKSTDQITIQSISKGALFENWQAHSAVLLGSY